MFAVFKREYLQAVRKKMFIVMTFLMPLLMAAAFILPSLLMVKGMGVKRVVIVDGTGRLAEAYAQPNTPTAAEKQAEKQAEKSPVPRRRSLPSSLAAEYVNASAAGDVEATAKPYLDRVNEKNKAAAIDGVLVIPRDAIANVDAKLKYYARSSTDFITQERLQAITNDAVQRIRLTGRGIDPSEIENLMSRLTVDAVQLSRAGEQKTGGAANFMVGFLFAALLMIPSFTYGLEIMRGIVQEKSDRVVEVLISSMSPQQLLVGKILGVAAVGLTQIGVWLLMALGIGIYGATAAALSGYNVMQYLSPSLFVYFVVFFVLAYLTYVCVYAIGGAVCNTEKEAQQLTMPIIMIMMLPWFMMAAIITSPDSALSVGLSLAPVFGPLTMFVRTIVSQPPLWHVAVSIAGSIATIAIFFWMTAKIFRVGILSYGKRPTIMELWRWLKVA